MPGLLRWVLNSVSSSEEAHRADADLELDQPPHHPRRPDASVALAPLASSSAHHHHEAWSSFLDVGSAEIKTSFFFGPPPPPPGGEHVVATMAESVSSQMANSLIPGGQGRGDPANFAFEEELFMYFVVTCTAIGTLAFFATEYAIRYKLTYDVAKGKGKKMKGGLYDVAKNLGLMPGEEGETADEGDEGDEMGSARSSGRMMGEEDEGDEGWD
mmetsp:Transcript_145319/g.253612  ORF Transcript_145319/g.253612 Transcript_145319/m.253612 type:complete len:214 (+) Transcript_145319:92-733(+)